MSEKQTLIIGAGITGCTLARGLTEQGKRVLVVDKRDQSALELQ
jgi:glycine/D-amino acid oxidase-like deaminating enzyme